MERNIIFLIFFQVFFNKILVLYFILFVVAFFLSKGIFIFPLDSLCSVRLFLSSPSNSQFLSFNSVTPRLLKPRFHSIILLNTVRHSASSKASFSFLHLFQYRHSTSSLNHLFQYRQYASSKALFSRLTSLSISSLRVFYSLVFTLASVSTVFIFVSHSLTSNKLTCRYGYFIFFLPHYLIFISFYSKRKKYVK